MNPRFRRLMRISGPALLLLAAMLVLVQTLPPGWDRGGEGVVRALAAFSVVLLAGVALWAFSRRWRMRGATGAAAQARPGPASAEPGSVLRSGLRAAVESIRASDLGRRAGRNALGQLPWYGVIGAEGAGKTALIKQSGLSFPFEHLPGCPDDGDCGWFLATEAVVLDLGGRYLSDSLGDSSWLEFWRELKRLRPAQPLDGLVAAVSAAELLGGDERALHAHATRVRACIDEIQDAVGVRLPVYLVVTQLDLIGQGALPSERDAPRSPFGFAIPAVPADRTIDSVAERFALFRAGLRHHVLAAAEMHDPLTQSEQLSFSVEFDGLGARLNSFVRVLLGNNPYHVQPALRGVYFSSLPAGGGHTVLGPRTDALAHRFELDLSDTRSSGFRHDRQDGPSPARLFHDVVLPDRFFARRLRSASASRGRWAWMATSLAVVCLAVGLMTASFTGNHQLLTELAASQHAAQTSGDGVPLVVELERLVALQHQLERLRRYRLAQPPWRLRFGLYQGDKVEAMLRARYFAGVRQLMLEPVAREIERELGATASAPVRRAGVGRPAGAVTANDRPPAGLPIIPLGEGAAAQPLRAAGIPPGGPALSARVRRSAGESAGIEGQYNALKTYLMLADPSRIETEHLADQLPRFWRRWLHAERGQTPLPDIYALAQRMVDFYIEERAAPDLPVIAAEGGLVARSRSALIGAMRRLPPEERIYRALLAAANVRFEPVSVTGVLRDHASDLVGGSVVVPGAFTRKAYDEYLHSAFGLSGRDLDTGTDWVLDDHAGNLAESSSGAVDPAALERRYREDFEIAWLRFLQGLTVPVFADLAAATDALGQLGDPARSPLLPLLQRAGHELGGWGRAVEGEKGRMETVLARARGVLDAGRSEAVADAGPASEASPLPGVVALAGGPVEAGDPRLDGALREYLGRLLKLRDRLAVVAAAGSDAEPAIRLVRATFDGRESEFPASLSFVDNELLGAMDSASRTALRPVLTQPVLRAFDALIPLVSRDLDLAWQREVLPHWRRLAENFPFSDSEHDVVPSELAEFAAQGGVLDRFVERRLEGLVSRRGQGLATRNWGDRSLALNPAFLPALERLLAFGAALPRQGELARFELQPMPTPGLTEIVIEIDGQSLRYRNGPQTWASFNWPGTAVQEAAVRVVDMSGAPGAVLHRRGRMALIRLLAEASVQGATPGPLQFAWNGAGAAVRFNFRSLSGASPLDLLALRKLTLPDRISR